MSKQITQQNLRSLVLCSVFSALIIVMTVVPYLGYISYGVIEITTLHIVTAIGAVCLGWKYGAVIGGVWGITCLVRAYVAFPVYLDFGFGNFFVSVLPRILVGLIAGAVFAGLRKLKLNDIIAAGIAAAVGSVSNTALVLSAMNLWLKFNGGEYSSFFDVFKNIFKTLIAVNGIIEIVASIIIVPIIYKSISSYKKTLYN